jgi:hypothetical protein
MMMTSEELERLNASNAKVAAEARRVELAVRIDRLRDHVERVGESPGIVTAIEQAKAELEALERGTPA